MELVDDLKAQIADLQAAIVIDMQMIAQLSSALTKHKADTFRLDWLEAQIKDHPVHTGYEWHEGGYENDRGLVCVIRNKKQAMTARQAIDLSMKGTT